MISFLRSVLVTAAQKWQR